MNRIIQAARVVCSRHSSAIARAEPESRVQKEKIWDSQADPCAIAKGSNARAVARDALSHHSLCQSMAALSARLEGKG